MTEEKRNRLIAAITVNVILLIVVLAAVSIYQIVEMVSLGNIKSKMQQQLEYYQTETDKAERTLDYYKSEEGMTDFAYKYDWHFSGNSN